MDALARARKLADFISRANGLVIASNPPRVHGHIGATLADAVLQAGLNYRNVVMPRVERLKRRWPQSCLTAGFWADLSATGPHEMLNWNHDEKPRRLVALTELCIQQRVNTETDLCDWLSLAANRIRLLEIKGVGPKTVDYLSRLVGGATIAVDRHIRQFVALSSPNCKSYEDIRAVVCFAADLLGVDRRCLDHAIWKFMSLRGVQNDAGCHSDVAGAA